MEWGATRGSGTFPSGSGVHRILIPDYMTDKSRSAEAISTIRPRTVRRSLHYCGEAVSGLRFYIDLGGTTLPRASRELPSEGSEGL